MVGKFFNGIKVSYVTIHRFVIFVRFGLCLQPFSFGFIRCVFSLFFAQHLFELQHPCAANLGRLFLNGSPLHDDSAMSCEMVCELARHIPQCERTRTPRGNLPERSVLS